MLTGQNINYILLPLRKFVLQEGILKKKKKKRKGKKKVPTKRKTKNCYFCGLHSNKVQPLPNDISIENGKNDVL